MAGDCIHYGGAGLVFPKPIANRPALPQIDYRVGVYADFLAAMRAEIDSATALRAWTHREPDDPGIALVEGAAIVADILTFYQQHYANEAYLRTAQWRESVAELVRLLGYRLAPGLAGVATFAFTIRGGTPVTVPAGFPLKAEVGDGATMVDFETVESLLAYPHLGRFSLYRPRTYASTIAAGTTRLELQSAGGATSIEARRAVGLKAGDRLMLMPSESMWSSNVTFTTQEPHQVVTVASVTETLDRFVIELEEELHRSWTAPVRAFRLKRTFQHFGHNAPPTYTVSKKSGSEVTGAYEYSVDYTRHLYHGCTQHSIDRLGTSLTLGERAVPLNEEATLTLGGWLIVETRVAIGSTRYPMLVARIITSQEAAALSCGSIRGTATLITLGAQMISNSNVSNPSTDLRDFRFHEVTSPRLQLRNVAGGQAGAFPSTNDALFYFGSSDQVRALAGRRLLLQHEDGRSAEVVCTNTADSFTDAAEPRTWMLDFDRLPDPFTRADFAEDESRVTVLGNVADATQGKTEQEAALGNGDARAAFQTFKLPKNPLTYLLRPGATPPQQPELEIRVNSRLWTRVESLFGHGPNEEIYVVREDAAGESYVQFGDGESGARLPSGQKNVVASFRSGSGAYGAPRPNANPSAGQRLDGLDKVLLPALVTGGSSAEAADSARVAAPGKVQSLGRLVSLRDYETEVIALPGVVAVAAAWDLHNHIPSLMLRVLLEGGREGEFAAIQEQIELVRQCRGPSAYPVVVEQARLRYVYLDVEYAFDHTLLQDDVEAALRAALGLAGDEAAGRSGLFGLYARRLGEREYASRIEGVLQNVPGILWCSVTALARFASGINPDETPLPAYRVRHAAVNCPPSQLLQLHDRHLTLTSVAAPITDPCV